MRRTLSTLALVLLVVPLAAGQVPPSAPPACGPIAATAVAPATLGPGEAGTVTLTITNTGARPVTATASMVLLGPGTGGSSGWTGGGDKTVQVPAASGSTPGSATAEFGVGAEGEAIAEVTVSFSVTGACAAPIPGVDCPQSACVTNEAAASQRIRYEAPEPGLQIPFLAGLDLRPEVVIALLVLLGILASIPLLLRKRPRALSADCAEPLKTLKPGKGASFPIAVTNPSPDAIRADLEVGAVPEGWTAFLPLPDLQLAPRESRNLFLMVRAPDDAAPGETVDVEVTVRNAARPDRPSLLRVRAEVEG